MHVHPASSPTSSQSEDDAATKIQAGFRGYRVRKQLKQFRKSSKDSSKAKDRNFEKRPSIRSLEERSATKIQAGIRGFLVRKKNKIAHEAATKIQASFRGFKVRKQFGKTSPSKQNPAQ